MPASRVGHSAKSMPPLTTPRVGRSARPKVITSSGTFQNVVPASGCTEKGGHTDGLFQQCNPVDQTEPEAEFSPDRSTESILADRVPEVAYDELLSRLADSRLTLKETASVVPIDKHMARPVPIFSKPKWVGLAFNERDVETCCQVESNEHLGEVLKERIGAPYALESFGPPCVPRSSEDSMQRSLQRLFAWLDSSHSKVHRLQWASKVPMEKQMARPVPHDASVGETHCQLESEEHLGQVLQERVGAAPALTSLVPSVLEADEKEDTWDDKSQSEISRATTWLEYLSESSPTTAAPMDEGRDGSLLDDAFGVEIRGPFPFEEHLGQVLQERVGAAPALTSLVPSVLEADEKEDTWDDKSQSEISRATTRLEYLSESSPTTAAPMDEGRDGSLLDDAFGMEIRGPLPFEEHLGQVLQERVGAAPALTSLVPSVLEADEKEDTWDDKSQSEISRATTRVEYLSESSPTTIAPMDEDMDGSLPDDAFALEIRGPLPLKEQSSQELQGCLGEASAPKSLVPSVFEMVDWEDTSEESTQWRLSTWLDANHDHV